MLTRDELESGIAGHCKNSCSHERLILSEMESPWEVWAEECSAQICTFKGSPIASSPNEQLLLPGLTIQFGNKSNKNKTKALDSLIQQHAKRNWKGAPRNRLNSNLTIKMSQQKLNKYNKNNKYKWRLLNWSRSLKQIQTLCIWRLNSNKTMCS